MGMALSVYPCLDPNDTVHLVRDAELSGKQVEIIIPGPACSLDHGQQGEGSQRGGEKEVEREGGIVIAKTNDKIRCAIWMRNWLCPLSLQYHKDYITICGVVGGGGGYGVVVVVGGGGGGGDCRCCFAFQFRFIFKNHLRKLLGRGLSNHTLAEPRPESWSKFSEDRHHQCLCIEVNHKEPLGEHREIRHKYCENPVNMNEELLFYNFNHGYASCSVPRDITLSLPHS
ncbi:hypothetical protein PoB_003487400 [Plakobranchus ocellatus]|uniref:Uncharacterized protein n=1 Tax=Plakobranchus ocellatus TaxID=259542 RepID=A0AAV4AQD8_9GAST|nr:hypothetical protein PoB_003487400 [Plakobranchus ocellatus]